jgi:hypothetical protein
MIFSAEYQRCGVLPEGPCGWMATAILYSSQSLSRLSKLSGSGSALRRGCRLASRQFLVGLVVLREALHAEGDGGNLIVLAEFEDRFDLLLAAVERDVLVVELGVLDPELLGALQGLLEVEVAERVALDGEGEAAKGVRDSLLGAEQRRQGGGPEGSGAGLEETTASQVRVCHGGGSLRLWAGPELG